MTGNTANFFAKASILLFVQRLFPRHVSPKTAFAIWFGIIANIIAYITLTVYLGVVCTPRNGAFPATCPGPLQNHVGVAASVVNAFLDIYTLGVSVPTLWMLQMPLRRRVSVVGVLSLGLVYVSCFFVELIIEC
jgi:sorbitol-specific phosphotransferase system component IIC